MGAVEHLAGSLLRINAHEHLWQHMYRGGFTQLTGNGQPPLELIWRSGTSKALGAGLRASR